MTADHWTHHDPAVRALIRAAQAEAWDEGYVQADYDARHDPDVWPARLVRNPYREAAR